MPEEPIEEDEDPEEYVRALKARAASSRRGNSSTAGPLRFNELDVVMDEGSSGKGRDPLLRAMAAPHVEDKGLFRVPLRRVSYCFVFLFDLFTNTSIFRNIRVDY